MLAGTLHRLADVAEMTKVDLHPGAMTIASTKDGKLFAYYYSSYIACGIQVAPEFPLDLPPVSISPTEFQSLIGLYKEADQVTLTIEGNALIIRGQKGRKVSLKLESQRDVLGFAEHMNAPLSATINLPELTREVQLASAAAATTLSNPILTGVRVVMGATAAGLQAANAISIIFESMVAGSSPEPLEIIAPAQDFQRSVRVLTGETAQIGRYGERSMLLRAADSFIRLPFLAGVWPAPHISKVRDLDYKEQVTIEADAIRSLVSASRAYKSENWAIIMPTNGGVMLETIENERGQFQEFLPGFQITRKYRLDTNDLDFASKLGDGSLTIAFAETMGMVKAGGRRLFINTASEFTP